MEVHKEKNTFGDEEFLIDDLSLLSANFPTNFSTNTDDQMTWLK